MLTRCLGRRSRALIPQLFLLLLVVVMGLLAADCLWAAPSTGPTVRDLVEFTRIAQPLDQDSKELQTQIAPDGKRAFIVTRKGDVANDKVVFQLLLLDISRDRLENRRDVPPQLLLTVDGTRDFLDWDPSLQEARWVDDRSIVFRGRIGDLPYQAYRLDVPTRKLTRLTFDDRKVWSFAVSDDARRIVYAVQVPNPPYKDGARSLVVDNRSLWSTRFGQSHPYHQQRVYQYMVADIGSRKPARPLGEPFAEASGSWPRSNISPDGRWALLHRWEPQRQLAWAKQYPLVAGLFEVGDSLRSDPLAYFSRPNSAAARRIVAFRLSDGHEQMVVDAPDDAMRAGNQIRQDQIWQPGGNSVVIAGTHLPLTETQTSTASQIIEYWPNSGRWTVVAALGGRLTEAYAVVGGAGDFVALDADKPRRFAKAANGSWQEVEKGASAPGGRGMPPPGWILRIDESLNRPSDVVAVGPGGTIVPLTRLNPQFSADAWGTVRPYAWKDALGRTWDGGLLMPADGRGATPRPVLIQTYGFTDKRFFLDGANESDGFTSGFPGRALIREGIVMLQLPYVPTDPQPEDVKGTPRFIEGVRSAIRSLVADGIADPQRIGIIGFSATGERVLNLVTFTDIPIRAASLIDGDSNTLFSMVVTYAASETITTKKEKANGGALPFGASFGDWARRDPSMNTHCIKAALRIEQYGQALQNNWDIYMLMRRQYKAAEMLLIPEGGHSLARPSERMVSLQGNLDWYRFWLADQVRTEVSVPGETRASLDEQYRRWHQMAELKKADDLKPRCSPTAP